MKATNYVTLKLAGKSVEFTISYDSYSIQVTANDGCIVMGGYFTNWKKYDYMVLDTHCREVSMFSEQLEIAVRKSIKSDKALFKSIIGRYINV